MTSGVYQLTFPGGATYIGKSINIEERWKQHTNKMYKGTAAKNMQAAFNTYGAPMGRILRECHEDHIDVVESCFISRNQPTLNSDRPKDPFPDLDTEQLDYLFNTFTYSARDLVAINLADEAKAKKAQESLSDTIETRDEEIVELYAEIVELTELNDQLLKKRSAEELQADISGKLKEQNKYISTLVKSFNNLDKDYSYLQQLVDIQEKELKYHRLPWWKKLF